MIIRAIRKFIAAYEATRPEFEEFSKWAVINGYTKSPLTTDGRSGLDGARAGSRAWVG
jgi:hypothetical protein